MIQPSRSFTPIVAASLAVVALATLGSCGKPSAPDDQLLSVAEIEQLFSDTRALGDQIDVTRNRGATTSTTGVALADLIGSYSSVRIRLQRALSAGASSPTSEEDLRALAAMRRTLEIYLPEESNESTSATADTGESAKVECGYDPESVANGEGGYEALSKRIYDCFSEAAHSLSFEGEPMDRLTVFGRLPSTDEPSRREGLWRAMAPIWESVNGDNGPQSPYRTLIRLNAARMKIEGEVLGDSVRGIGVEPEVMEGWLTQVLQKWHDITPATAIEPWDFAYHAGRGNRALSDAIPADSLRAINDRFYRDLGADPVALQVRYDLEPRPSKDPVAFATFGRRPRFAGGAWVLGEPWVFASYQIGGLDNLLELLHETGHAIHIAAIRTRPAFMDWPDSDIFTEGVADIATWEMYEPLWQERYLGTSVSIEDAIAAKYAAIVMDIAWALFEVRMHRGPERDPNEVWGEICQRYFRINPHPGLAWWAVRGQLIDSPGYMMNYAAGAIMNADLRVRARELYGSYTEGDPDWYARISEGLYRFGLEKTSKEVVEAFLGRPVSPQALLDDMSRASAGAN
jgi:hypothetical protein